MLGQGALAQAQHPAMLAPSGQIAPGLSNFDRYLILPLVAVAGSVLILAPGLALALAGTARRARPPGLADLVFRGYAISLLGLSALAAVIERLGAAPLVGERYWWLLGGVLLLSLAVLGAADRKGRVGWDAFSRNRWALVVAFLLPVAMIGLMAPKFLWEDLNGDGADLFSATHSLIELGLPIRPLHGDLPEFYPGEILAEVFNAALFMRLFGESALALRLPMTMGFALLAVALIGMIGRGRGRAGANVALSVGAALLLISWVLAYQASYNPYFADIALPGGREPFVSFWLLGLIWFWLEGRAAWVALMAALLTITVPSAPLLMALWGGAWALFCGGLRRKRGVIAAMALGLAGGVLLSGLLPEMARMAGLARQSGEFASASIAQRLRFITLGDHGRLLYWILPGGILPALSLLLWPWQDRLGRALSVMVLIYAAFFQLQAFRVLPHHFSVAMVLPLIVFWRLRLPGFTPRRAAAALTLAVAVAAFLSRPPDARPHMDTRLLARQIRLAPDLALTDEGWAAFARMHLMAALLRKAFPPGYVKGADEQRYIVSPIAIVVMKYLDRPPAGPEGEAAAQAQGADFAIRPAGGPAIFSAPVPLAEREGIGLYARSEAAYRRALRHRVLVRSLGNPIYAVPRERIFGRARSDPRVIDLARLFGLR